MCHPFANTILPAAISAVAGVCAWLGTNFFAEPLLSFYRRRRTVRESLIYAANVGTASKPEIQDSACGELRRHAAAIEALDETMPKIIKRWLRFRGFDLKTASSAIIGFSNNLSAEDGSRGVFRKQVQQALRYSKDV